MTQGAAPEIDPAFLALPMRRLADAALGRARELGAGTPTSGSSGCAPRTLALRDGKLDSARDGEDLGYAVRVVHDGTWGFASGVDLTLEAAVRVAEQAVAVAKVEPPGQLASRSSWPTSRCTPDVTWVSSYEIDPFGVPDAEKIGLLAEWSERLLAADGRRPRRRVAAVRSRRTSSTRTRPARSPPSSGCGCTRS